MRNPFIAGSWVRGENFFGRGALLRELIEGERDCLWVLGARRLGKTSLLKEAELRVQRSPRTTFVALYWDLQGSGDAQGLADGLLGSVEDSEDFRRATDVAVEDLEGLAVADMLTSLVRRTVRSGWRLLLLVDEAEELLTIGRQDASALPKLRRVFQRGPEMRVVLTATRRLARLDIEADIVTSPFLQGFIPPLYLTPLADDEARALLVRGEFEDAAMSRMMERTANHPFLLQLIASRLFENRDIDGVLAQLADDEMVANFFAVDFQTLDLPERAVLEELARHGARDRGSLAHAGGIGETHIDAVLLGLRSLGYLAENSDGAYRLGNWFFERWLRRVVAAPDPARA